MYKTIIGILGGISLSLLYYYFLEIPKLITKLCGIKLVKPFSCPFCMSFWLSFIYNTFNTDCNFIDAVYVSTITPILYLFIEEQILKKWNF
jgi:hypothetical protein